MKRNHLFGTFIFICLAIMVAVGSVFAVAAPVQTLQLQAAGTARNLFDENGDYAVAQNQIVKGATFGFFGFDWKVVNVNGSVATFWMVDPYTTHNFNSQTVSGDANLMPDNLWSNGYSRSVAGGKVFSDSSIRAFLQSEAERILNDDAYKAYRDKVLPGYQDGSNWENSKAKRTITNGSAAIEGNITGADGKLITKGVYYANSNPTNFYKTDGTTGFTEMTAYYDLDAMDTWWLPAAEEVMDGGVWDLDNTYRNWHSTSVSNLAWLRTADPDCNFRAYAVAYNPSVSKTGLKLAAVDRSVTGDNYTLGVRPAIHMNIASAGTTGSNGSSSNGKSGIAGWFTDDMMKVFFIVICVLGVIAIVLVVIAVVRKVRERKQQQGN